MKKYSFMFLILVLMISSLACQTLLGGGGGGTQPVPPVDGSGGQPTASIDQPGSTSSSGGEAKFPMLDDASNIVDAAGVLNYQTHNSLPDVIKFYRDTLSAQGYTERSINAAITDTTFNLVFDGDPSGQALVIQGVDLGGGNSNVTIFLQDM